MILKRPGDGAMGILRDERGFTLLEVCLAIAVLAVVAAAGAAVVRNEVRLFNERDAEYEAFQNARLAMSVVVEELRRYTELVLVSEQGGWSVKGVNESSRTQEGYMVKVLSDGHSGDREQYKIYYDAESQSLMAGGEESGVYAAGIERFDVRPGTEVDGEVRTVIIEITPAGCPPIATELRLKRYPAGE